MANELKVSAMLQLNNAGQITQQSVSGYFSPSAKVPIAKPVTIATTAGGQALDFTGLTAARFIILKNTDMTNWVEVGPDDGGTILPLARLQPGDPMILPLRPSTTIRAIANTSACVIHLMAVDT